DPNLTLAQALHGTTPPGGRLYRGRPPLSLFFAAGIVFLGILLFLGLYLVGGPPLFLILSATIVAAAAPAFVSVTRRRLRHPDLVVTLPDGFITFMDSAQILAHPY